MVECGHHLRKAATPPTFYHRVNANTPGDLLMQGARASAAVLINHGNDPVFLEYSEVSNNVCVWMKKNQVKFLNIHDDLFNNRVVNH